MPAPAKTIQDYRRAEMTRPLPITARQVTAICKGAEKAGYVPLIEIGNTVVRLIPAYRAIHPQADEPIDDERFKDL
jgi:hypothetical protein